ncbi:MAG TPA: permease-like cell division protein FtsX [Pseudobacteroides sp.]|nr:permease-like cell division protein FtsX [Pseudobacteroides sp.]
MKIRTTKYIIKEGIINSYRNKLMSLASIIIVTASLLVFGIFLIISVNFQHKINEMMESQLQIEVYCDANLDETQVKDIEAQIKMNSFVSNVRRVTKEEALERCKALLEEDGSILEGYDGSFLPESFIVKINNSDNIKRVVEEFKALKGVESVGFLEDNVNQLSSISYWARFISILLLVILLSVSIFIISNTIKLTVFARRREIGIMKYIGATDWFIRLPFIVEGIIIGIVGAIISFIVTYYCYSTIESQLSNGVLGETLEFVSINSIVLYVIGSYSIIGTVVGGIGSGISIRKYLRV